MQNALHMVKQNDMTRNVSFEFLCALDTKTLKSMETTLYGNITQHYQKRFSAVFRNSLRTKKLKHMKNILMEKQNNISKNVCF